MNLSNYCELPTLHGTFRMYDTNDEMLRLVTFGDITAAGENPIIRIHSSCLASEVFGARDCDCADQLLESMKLIAQHGHGMIFHLHQEGRGQGLSRKIMAVHKMQTKSLDTVEAFQALNLEQDIRDYTPVLGLLTKLNIKQVRLVSNNPRKRQALEHAGISVKTLNTHPQIRSENADYLKSKNEKLAHSIPLETSYNKDNAAIYFYHSEQAWGAFSNFARYAIYQDNKIWQTTEHFYQAQKFTDPELQECIRLTASPMLAKQLSNELADNHQKVNWNAVKEDAMQKALMTKFTQHPELADLLLSTGERKIIEHAPNDCYWGDSGDGTGLNRLGELLVSLRKKIKKNSESQACVE